MTEDWTRAKLGDLVREQLGAFNEPGPRLQIAGPEVFLTPSAAQQIGLALHELATNAVKHGAWSVPTGTVSVAWAIPDDGECCQLSWRESGGPHVTPPSSRGFGTTVIDSLVKQSLNANVKMDYAPAGFSWTLDFPCANNILSTL